MLYYAMKKAPKGSVIVIDRMGEHRYACCGEIVVMAAISLGMAGIVIDGPSTDTIAITELGLPVFSTGRSAVTTTLLGISGEYDIPVSCGGTVVNPGDIIFGDVDGVIVSPKEKFVDLLCKAEAADAMEVGVKKALLHGGYITDFIDIENLVESDSLSMLKKLMEKNNSIFL
jgi:regulator of RNase E activity RraA